MNWALLIFAVAIFTFFWHGTKRWIRLRTEADAIEADELKLKACDRCNEWRAKDRNFCPNCGLEQKLNAIKMRRDVYNKKWESWRIPAKT